MAADLDRLKELLREDLSLQREALLALKEKAAGGDAGAAAQVPGAMQQVASTQLALDPLNRELSKSSDLLKKRNEQEGLLSRSWSYARNQVESFARSLVPFHPSPAGVAAAAIRQPTGLQSQLQGSWELVLLQLQRAFIPTIVTVSKELQTFAHNLREKGLLGAIGELSAGVKIAAGAFLGFRLGGIPGALLGGFLGGLEPVATQLSKHRAEERDRRVKAVEEKGGLAGMLPEWMPGRQAALQYAQGLVPRGREIAAQFGGVLDEERVQRLIGGGRPTGPPAPRPGQPAPAEQQRYPGGLTGRALRLAGAPMPGLPAGGGGGPGLLSGVTPPGYVAQHLGYEAFGQAMQEKILGTSPLQAELMRQTLEVQQDILKEIQRQGQDGRRPSLPPR